MMNCQEEQSNFFEKSTSKKSAETGEKMQRAGQTITNVGKTIASLVFYTMLLIILIAIIRSIL